MRKIICVFIVTISKHAASRKIFIFQLLQEVDEMYGVARDFLFCTVMNTRRIDYLYRKKYLNNTMTLLNL